MNVYSGIGRRQVGGGIWSTITRGLIPLFLRLKEQTKPLAKRAVQSALTVGTNLATDALAGNLNRGRVKTALRNEAEVLKNEAITGLKRKLNEQTGSGYKRRKISNTANTVRMKPIASKRRQYSSRHRRKPKNKTARKQYKRKTKRNTRVSKKKKKKTIKRKYTNKRRNIIKDVFTRK